MWPGAKAEQGGQRKGSFIHHEGGTLTLRGGAAGEEADSLSHAAEGWLGKGQRRGWLLRQGGHPRQPG